MANQNDLFYRPDIPAPEKDTDLSGFTSKTDKAAIDAIAKLNAALSENDVADELIYKSINELAEEVYGTSKTSAIDALIAQFATHEKNAEIVRERLLFLIDIMIEDMNADLANAPAIVKQYVTDLTGIVIADDVTTLDAVNTLLANSGSWFRQLIGAEVTQSELNKMHVNDRDSAEAAAEGLKRELEIGLGFIAGLKRTGNSIQKFCLPRETCSFERWVWRDS